MQIDSEVYKGIKINISYHKRDAFPTPENPTTERRYFVASSVAGTSSGYCETPNAVVAQVKEMIDTLHNATPSNYEELAKELTNTLVWGNYIDYAIVDPQILEVLVERFLKFR